MKKLCDTCRNYVTEHQFCWVRLIKIGRNLVDYCKDYVPKGGRNYGEK